MPTLNSKDGITNFAKKTPAADNLVLSADEHQPKAENYEGDEEEKRKSAPPETTASTSVKTSSIYGFSIVDLLTVSGPSCSRHRRRSATTMISTRKNNEKIKELDEPPIKKTFKSESYDIKEENLHSKPYNDAFLHFHRTDKP
uniref:Uncharacterized protein n=1 Tax=Meloidogyne hapla TaxID=6305 RepID=A0A1I8BXE1_MELHA